MGMGKSSSTSTPQVTEEQKDLLREATEYVAVAMGLIKKIESLNDNTNN